MKISKCSGCGKEIPENEVKLAMNDLEKGVCNYCENCADNGGEPDPADWWKK